MNKALEYPSQKILVVDDEQSIRDLLSEALVHLGHEVETACNGSEAIAKLKEGKFDIIITDIIMPKMDGLELIRYLVKNQKGISVIAITGHTMTYQYTDVITAGASDFIAKPFTMNELEAKLNRILRERYLLEELERLAVKDPLTGLFNRRQFTEVSRKEAARSERYRHPLCLFSIDIDKFKVYNDVHGHQAGDQLLTQFARILTSSVRQNIDTTYRLGGDEFAVLLPHLTADLALQVANRIRDAYNALRFEPTSLSLGIAHFIKKTGDSDRDIEDMVRRSDRALYHTKRNMGGNAAHFDEESAQFQVLN
jgi:two-component system, cell cycle response regulator